MSKPKLTAPPIVVELRPIEWLVPYEANAKKHPEEQVERLAATIKRMGWDQPIVAWTDGSIIKGHGRRLAAIKLGMTHVPVVVRSDMTRAEADAARIADNAAVSQSFDTRALQSELKRLMAIEPSFTADDLGLSEQDGKLLLDSLDVPEMDALMEDTTTEIEKQKRGEEARVAEVDGERVRLVEAFGFKDVSRADVRVIAQAVANAEDVTGLAGSDAFVAWLKMAA